MKAKETKVGFFHFENIIIVLVSSFRFILKVIYHPLYSMNNFVTNKSKLSQDGAQVFHRIANHPHNLYGVIGYHVTL